MLLHLVLAEETPLVRAGSIYRWCIWVLTNKSKDKKYRPTKSLPKSHTRSELIVAPVSSEHPHNDECECKDGHNVMYYGAIGIFHNLFHVHSKDILLKVDK
jgi:hypothetical protein